MTRSEHNAAWDTNRQATERVQCHTIGYGELSQYDSQCAACWLGHEHDWAKHDRYVVTARISAAEHERDIACRRTIREKVAAGLLPASCES